MPEATGELFPEMLAAVDRLIKPIVGRDKQNLRTR